MHPYDVDALAKHNARMREKERQRQRRRRRLPIILFRGMLIVAILLALVSMALRG